jgi:CHAT domain-containing protein/tetratricopeptide (TPR) repeat protein
LAILPPDPEILKRKLAAHNIPPNRPLRSPWSDAVIHMFLEEADRDAPFDADAIAVASSHGDKPKEFTVAPRIRFPVGEVGPLERGMQILDARAIFYETLSRLDMARFLRQRAVTMCEFVLGERVSQLLSPLVELAELEIRMGDFTSADIVFNRAVAISQSIGGDNPFELARILHARGRGLARMGLLKGAARAIQKAIDLLASNQSANSRNIAILEEDLAVVFLKSGRSDLAKPVIQRVVDRMDWEEMSNLPPERQDGIANYLLLLEKFDEAAKLSDLALQQLEEQTGEWTPAYAHILSNSGTIHRMKGRWQEAARAFTRAAQIRRTVLGPDHPAVGQSLLRLALTKAAAVEPEHALTAIREALAISDRLLGDLSSMASEGDRLMFLSEMRSQTMVAVAIIRKFFIDDPELVAEAYKFVLHRKALSAEVLVIQRNAILSGRYPHLADQLSELDGVRSRIVQSTLTQSPEEEKTQHWQLLNELRAHRDELSSQLSKQIPELRLERTLAASNWSDIAAALPPDTRLAEFFVLRPPNFGAVLASSEEEFDPSRYLVFTIEGGFTPRLRLLDIGAESDLNDRMSKVIQTIVSEEVSGNPAASELGAMLQPIFAEAPRRLLIAPDGNIALLPIDALFIAETSSLVIDRHEITFLGSGRDLVQSRDRDASSVLGLPVIVAAPDFDIRREQNSLLEDRENTQARAPSRGALIGGLGKFEQLPGAANEGRALAALIPHATLLTAGEATTSAFRALHRPSLVHLATHAFVLNTRETMDGFDVDQGADAMTASGVAMAGANQRVNVGGAVSPGEGILLAEDIATIDLLDTELVVLSACDTGKGLVMVGEGVFGLRRAFRIAGARTIVMTLWPIPDDETMQFMTMFYHLLVAGQSVASALRAAKLLIRQLYPSPYFWAGFVCEGESGAVRLLQVVER